MASPFTRSSRRSEGLSTRSSTRNNVVISRPHQGSSPANIGRKKRPRDEDPTDHDEDSSIVKKKARIAIEIASRSNAQPKTRSVVIKEEIAVAGKYAAAPPLTKSKQTETATQTEPAKPPQPLPESAKKPANHHEKVVNGIKHELDRLQPSAADLKDVKDDKRKLRSQEGTRFKSELSAYFPEYDEIIGNEPKEERRLADILNIDTPLSWPKPRKATLPRKAGALAERSALKDDSESLFTVLHNSHRIDSSVLSRNCEDGEDDPLNDDYFESIHRKPERQEKSIRNTDKGRAQHEKDQVIRLLEGLQGHDWLKLMGVSGITDSKKKDYEPAREHFIRGCEAIIEKFRIWRDEEKRRKLEREAAQAEAAEEEGEEDENGKEEEEQQEELEEDDGNVSDGDPPDYSDADASAARQLHEEAIARSTPALKGPGRGRPKAPLIPQQVEVIEKPFTSFFSKPYLREAALGKHRRSGRTVAAWGHPVPEVEYQDFDLPEQYRDEETLKIHARRKRRDRRVSKD
ncbi:uncharacterized protein LY89DRAFT_604932 [Mollisia scopiformis]|uniref:Something about silencing protein 4 domain-containing protein n=1 Tax=Mollisia scopiformis TaxID=149040 RepID=A0A194XVJ1_MOLSC|nr:uncharacterized protein LY89DRAFT_604932 [Mollisia scopiformis]KUJ24345.1 hypothetical protein LY89DRAFT_604932 [Mollisia scopiformis]